MNVSLNKRIGLLSPYATYAELLHTYTTDWYPTPLSMPYQWDIGNWQRDESICQAHVLIWDIASAAMLPDEQAQQRLLLHQEMAYHLEQLLAEKTCRVRLWILLNSAALYTAGPTPAHENDTAAKHRIAQMLEQSERAFHKTYVPRVRKIVIRSGILLHPALPWYMPLQFMLTHPQDYSLPSVLLPQEFAEGIDFIVRNENVEGIFNLATPSSMIQIIQKNSAKAAKSSYLSSWLSRWQAWRYQDDIRRIQQWAILSTDRIQKRGYLSFTQNQFARTA